MCKKTNYKIPNPRIDKCMKGIINFLNDRDYKTVASCCGHDKYPMTIIVEYVHNGIKVYREILSNKIINRKRNFYKRDNEGYYYILEIK